MPLPVLTNLISFPFAALQENKTLLTLGTLTGVTDALDVEELEQREYSVVPE